MKNILTTTTKTGLLLGITVLLFAGQAQAGPEDCQIKGGTWRDGICKCRGGAIPADFDRLMKIHNMSVQDLCDATEDCYWEDASCTCPAGEVLDADFDYCRQDCGTHNFPADQWSDEQQKCISAQNACHERKGHWLGVSCRCPVLDPITLECHESCGDDTPLSDKWSLFQGRCVSAETACKEKDGNWTDAGCDGGSIVALLTKRADGLTKRADKANKAKCRAALKDLYPNNGNGYWNIKTNGCQTPEAFNGCPDKGSEEVDENGVKVVRCKK